MKVVLPLFLLFVVGQGDVLPDGRGKTPLMGWRSWNQFGKNVNQELMIKTMDALVKKQRLVDGVPTSLCDLGYCDVGLDDNWQSCSNGIFGAGTYHDNDGNPVINTKLFPDMKGMNEYAHQLGLTSGWYGNNCICRSFDTNFFKYYDGDARATVELGFDSIKLDGCGAQLNMQLWHDRLFEYAENGILIENCHWGSAPPAFPTKDWCPWSYYRTSVDISAVYGSVLHNLQSTIGPAKNGLSRPGCWAYPDMLEVGLLKSDTESKSHFAAWCIVSSPLILSFDVTNDDQLDTVWNIITNREAIAINQAWFGHPGTAFYTSSEMVSVSRTLSSDLRANFRSESAELEPFDAPVHQYFYKPLSDDGSKSAVLLMNNAATSTVLSIKFSTIPSLKCTNCLVRDVWAKKDIGVYKDSFSCKADGHGSCFIIVSEPSLRFAKIVNIEDS